MKALLLAAGLGTRLRPLTNTVPKCLVEINGKPLLDYWLRLLDAAGVREALLNVHHLPDAVYDYLRSSRYRVRVTTVFEPILLGTAGTLGKNRKWFADGEVLLIHADNLSLFCLSSFLATYHRRSAGVDMTMMTYKTDDPRSCGIVTTDALGIVQAFFEKVVDPPSCIANGAVYVVSSAVIDFIASLQKEVVDFSTEVIPHFVGRINTFHNHVYHRDVGTVESLKRAREEYPEIERGYLKLREEQGR